MFFVCSGVLMCTDVMARGIDFPAVDWVLQFDPPSSSKLVIADVPHVHLVLVFICHIFTVPLSIVVGALPAWEGRDGPSFSSLPVKPAMSNSSDSTRG